MFNRILDLWMNVPTILRIGLSVLLIGISVAVYFVGYIWIWPGAVGLVLLCASMLSSGDNGYNF
jgi:hypothetical protein